MTFGRLQIDERGALDIKVFQDPTFHETFRVLPVHFRLIGAEMDPDYPTRPRLMFAGEVRDGQTMLGRVEMTPEGHLRWKWVRLHIILRSMQSTLIRPSRYAVRAVKFSGGIYSFSTSWLSLTVALTFPYVQL